MKKKKTFKKRSYFGLAVLFLAGTAITPAGNVFAATDNAASACLSSQDKTQYAIDQVKKTGSVTLSGDDQFDLQAFADAVNQDEDKDSAKIQSGNDQAKNDQTKADDDTETTTETSENQATTDDSTKDSDNPLADIVEIKKDTDNETSSDSNNDSDKDADSEKTDDANENHDSDEDAQKDPNADQNSESEESYQNQTDSNTDSGVNEDDAVTPDADNDSTNEDTDSEGLITDPTQDTDSATDENSQTDTDQDVPDVINKPGVTASEADEISMDDINNLSPKTYKTFIGKIAGFINDKVTDVTSGIVAALGYPLLFSRLGTQGLSDFRTFLSPDRYDVSNTWSNLDEQYDPDNRQVYYTAAQDWWDNEAVKEDVSVPYYDDANKSIRATYVAHPDSNKTVIIGQGWTERPDWIGVVSKVWYDMGYNVLMPSQRGQFASDGNLLSFGYYDKTDWKSLVNKVNQMNGDDGEIIFYGQSLGANTALEAASEDGLSKNVKAVVADAGYSTLPALGASLYNKALASVNSPLSKLLIPIHLNNIPFLPYEKIMNSMNNINKLLQGFGFDDVSGVVSAAKTTLPAYFITTEDDAFIPDSQSVAMYNANNSTIKKLWVLDGNVGGHASANNAVTEYQSNIQAFIDEVNKANNLKVNVEIADGTTSTDADLAA